MNEVNFCELPNDKLMLLIDFIGETEIIENSECVEKFINGKCVEKRWSYYSELIVTVPISKELPITMSAGIGWFYFQKDITMEYDINYAFRLKDDLSLIVTYNSQSAFGTTSQAFCIGLNKDF